MTVVAKVWIEEDCITCDACQDICPEVFEVNDETSQILAAVRVDGGFDRNEGKSPLSGDLGAQYGEIILEAAEACPVEVIKFELVSDGAETEEVAEAPAVEVAAAPAAAVAVSGSASEELTAVLGGDRSFTILFGSQTGNAAGLAEKTAKLASNYGLNANVVDMDGYDKANLASIKRLLIITSTWGEGEMPDNAEDLWQSVQSDAPGLSAMHYSVCAIGDTAYDEFCKAGTDWDDKLSSLGAHSVQPIQLCDVDFDEPWTKWVLEALPRIACVDESGTLQLELIDEMAAYGTSDDDDVVEGDFAPGHVDHSDIQVELELFRYCPSQGENGWDVIATMVPASASLEDLFLNYQRDVDGSFAFRRGTIAGTATTGVRANGRIVLADVARVGDVVSNGRLRIEPLPGFPILRDLIVDTRRFEENRAKANPWVQGDPREGERLISGKAVGVLASETALSLHKMNAVSSHLLAHGMSDTVDFDSKYVGPGIHLQRWVRINDPRTSAKQRSQLLATLQERVVFGVKQILHQSLAMVSQEQWLQTLSTAHVAVFLPNTRTLVAMDVLSSGMDAPSSGLVS